MGIPGLIETLGSGERVSLARLAVNHLQRNARPLRVAIDISIWLFQVQAGRGGANPELRTFFFRLVKLVGLPIHPLFVYDGPQRPSYKRGKVIGGRSGLPNSGPTAVIRRSKELLEHFRFPYHTAPGEAEAECARLQTAGVVDAVMSNDVDAVMFGSKVTIMNFSKESSSGTKAATHATVYRTEKTDNELEPNVKLDRAGMILFALLSGGDYIPAGVPKCGRKLAAEIARAGFGAKLIQAIDSTEADQQLEQWRTNLQKELHENEEKFFSCKHRAVHIPEDFPDKKALSFYSNPVVSSETQLNEIRQSLAWDQPVDMIGLRTFVGQEFGWKNLPGAKKFIRAFAAPFVSYKLRLGLSIVSSSNLHDIGYSPRLCGQRTHYATDGLLELRLEIVPADVVGLDLDSEPRSLSPQQERDLEDAEIAGMEADMLDQNSAPNQFRTSYDPTQPERIWIFEALAEIGIPDVLRRWKDEQHRISVAKASSPKKRRQKRGEPKVLDPGMKSGALRRYFPAVRKPGNNTQAAVTAQKPLSRDLSLEPGPSREAETRLDSDQIDLLAHCVDSQPLSQFSNESRTDYINSSDLSDIVDLESKDEDWLERCISQMRISDTLSPAVEETALTPVDHELDKQYADRKAPAQSTSKPQNRTQRHPQGSSDSIFKKYRKRNISAGDISADSGSSSDPRSSSVSQVDPSSPPALLPELFEKKVNIHEDATAASLSKRDGRKAPIKPLGPNKDVDRNPGFLTASSSPATSSTAISKSKSPRKVAHEDSEFTIETYNGFWNYGSRSNARSAPPEGGKPTFETSTDIKLGRRTIRGRVSILDLS